MSKKKKIIFYSITSFTVIIIIAYCAIYNYIFRNKYTIYIPTSSTINLYSAKDNKYYKYTNLEHISVFWGKPLYSQQFYDDTKIAKEKGKKILDYLNEFNIKEIHPVKFLNYTDNTPKKIYSIIFYHKNRYIQLSLRNKYVFEMHISNVYDNGKYNYINRTYLVKDNYIDENKIESILKD